MSCDRRQLRKKAASVRLIVSDVDGVWTDGGMYYSEAGDEWKKFNTRDGMAVELLRKHGVEVAWITGENTGIVCRRAAKLGIGKVFQGVKDKAAKLCELMDGAGLCAREVAYIGDDINDLPAFALCGLTATVADGMEEVLKSADYVCRLPGGRGAFREFAEIILSTVAKAKPAASGRSKKI